jgi:hypothetical protein
MILMLGQVYSGSSAFTYLLLDRVASDYGADHLFSRHAAKLIETAKTG